ncbi:hypothetical protein ACA910_016122 [Epithemia clementina (nom. ined.)]
MFGSNDGGSGGIGGIGDVRVKVTQVQESVPISSDEAVDFLTRFLQTERVKQDQAILDYSSTNINVLSSQSLWEDLHNVAYSMATNSGSKSSGAENSRSLKQQEQINILQKLRIHSSTAIKLEDDDCSNAHVAVSATSTMSAAALPTVAVSNDSIKQEVENDERESKDPDRKHRDNKEEKARRAAKKAKKEAKRARKEEKSTKEKKSSKKSLKVKEEDEGNDDGA